MSPAVFVFVTDGNVCHPEPTTETVCSALFRWSSFCLFSCWESFHVELVVLKCHSAITRFKVELVVGVQESGDPQSSRYEVTVLAVRKELKNELTVCRNRGCRTGICQRKERSVTLKARPGCVRTRWCGTLVRTDGGIGRVMRRDKGLLRRGSLEVGRGRGERGVGVVSRQ